MIWGPLSLGPNPPLAWTPRPSSIRPAVHEASGKLCWPGPEGLSALSEGLAEGLARHYKAL